MSCSTTTATNNTRKVHFALNNNQVHNVERLVASTDSEALLELYYQPQDYLQFRADFNVYKAKKQQRRRSSKLQRLMVTKVGGGISAHHTTPTILSAPLQPSQIQKSMADRGCARMA
ncbi:expressed unknown protein [Seminavis robusta]|uniref:Uncharacterized protein n=1 Tax=Seminavis robusta TaxID=568900 RepID=A0A9N8HE31_9STRA|nr:expressed unknown protein [Seminavis robusta]|eukprot:Sro284_g107890.1 n/a (117) ;mRNA; r:19408-19758